jgi:transposase
VVVTDNVPAHKVVEIEPLIQSVGTSVLYQSPYSPDFNPIKHWWSQLKTFLRSFSPTNAKMLDGLIAIALNARQSHTFKKLVYQLLLLYLINLK